MTEPRGQDAVPENRRLSSGALWIGFAGHLLALMAAASGSLPRNTAIVAAVACSIIDVAALTELAPLDMRARRAVTALMGGHGVAAAIMIAGLAPSVPWPVPLAGLAAAGTLGLACLVTVRRATVERRRAPLTMAPRVAAIALVAQALLTRWADSAPDLSMPLRALILVSIAALGVAVLASLSIIALRVPARWPIAGLLAWTVGWVATSADLSSLILWSLGGPFPIGPHQLRQLDAELMQILSTMGGVVVGAALVTSISAARFRHSAVVLLAGYAVFGLIAAVAEHRIELAPDFPSIVALRRNRDLADVITAFALAGVLWLYWRRVAASEPSRAWTRDS
jgi:hypothetical protein